MAEFTATVFQNEFLPDGGTDVHAIVTVDCSGAGTAGQTGSGAAGEIVIIDTSGSMGQSAMAAAKQAAQAALAEIVDGTYFAVISGNGAAFLAYPLVNAGPAMVPMSEATRAEAADAISRLRSGGGTEISTWLDMAGVLFTSVPQVVQRHAILLTDGENNEPAPVLDEAIARATGFYQCDCRGVGVDWKVEEIRRKLRQSGDLLPRGGEEPCPRLLVEVLVGHQLEEPGEREERGAELVRRIRDELLPRRVELRELDAHPLEGGGELAELVVAEIDHGLVELTLRDPVRGTLEAPDAARVERRCGAPEDRGDRDRDARRVQHPPLHDAHRRELVLDRRREEQHVAGDERNGDLGKRLVAALDTSAGDARVLGGLEADRVVADGACGRGRVRERPDRQGLRTEDLVDDDARVGQERRRVGEAVDGQRFAEVAARVGPCVRVRGRLRVALQLVEPLRHEPALEGGDDHQIRAAQRAAHDQEQRDRQRRSDPAREAHPAVARPSRNRYPAPRTVRISSGSRASRSIFSRRCRTCTSIVRGSR